MFNAAGKKAQVITTAILIAVGLLIPFFITSSYQLHLIIMLFINVVLAMSFSMLISTGLITIGAASFWAIGAYTSAILVLNYDLSFWIALPLATLVTGLVALALGAVIVRTPGPGTRADRVSRRLGWHTRHPDPRPNWRTEIFE